MTRKNGRICSIDDGQYLNSLTVPESRPLLTYPIHVDLCMWVNYRHMIFCPGQTNWSWAERAPDRTYQCQTRIQSDLTILDQAAHQQSQEPQEAHASLRI